MLIQCLMNYMKRKLFKEVYIMSDKVYDILKFIALTIVPLVNFVFLILTTCGVKEHQIDVTSLCTSCHHQVFFSHRREKGKTGRMMGFIGLKED